MALPMQDESNWRFRYCVRQVPRLCSTLLILLAACTSMPPPAPTITAADTPLVATPLPEPAAAGVANPEPLTLEDEADEADAEDEADHAVESTRRLVRSTAEWLARRVDSWFGDQPFEDGGKVTDGRITIGLLKRQDDKERFSLRFKARFRLPNVERQTYLFVGRDNQREVVTDKPEELSDQDRLLAETAEDSSFFAGLGRYLSDSVDVRLGLRGVKPYAQARYRRGWEIGERNLIEFRETLFWTVKDHFGSTTALSWERAYTSTLAVRWLGAATISQDNNRYAWSSILGAYKSFGERRLLSLEALVNGQQGSGVGASDYGVQTRWSQPLYEEWLIAEVLLGQFWPRKDVMTDRRRVWAVGGSLKMEF